MNEEFAGDILNLSWNIYENLVLKDHYEFSIKQIENAIKTYFKNLEKYRSYSNLNSIEELSEDFTRIGLKTRFSYMFHDRLSISPANSSFINRSLRL